MASAIVLVGAAGPARAEHDLCGPDARYRGAALDLDVKNADIHDVYRLLSDVGKVNIVLPDHVRGMVTMRLKRVRWDQIACTIAAIHRLAILVNGNVLRVVPRADVDAKGALPRPTGGAPVGFQPPFSSSNPSGDSGPQRQRVAVIDELQRDRVEAVA